MTADQKRINALGPFIAGEGISVGRFRYKFDSGVRI
jgi:hypothetical protein